MDVTEAVRARKSIRAFLPTPVPDDTIATLLEAAARAPSGGNLQPWHVQVLNGDALGRFLSFLEGRPHDEPEYPVYPPQLWEPYRTSRFELGEAMYELLEISRDDREARLARFAENHKFFGAPAGFFCFVDRRMGAAQWSDLGMFLQTFMLLAVEAGLGTCPQESWADYGPTVHDYLGVDDELMLFCGMAIGHPDPDAPVNKLVSERRPLHTWATFVG